jgi:outer membrane protein assembly factor BamD (BamD/ComL family)
MKSLVIYFSFLITLWIPTNAKALSAPHMIEDALAQFGIIPERGAAQSCPENEIYDQKKTAEELMNLAHKAESSYKKCEPLKYYQALLLHDSNSHYAPEARREILNTLFRAQDYVEAINQANDFLRDLQNNETEYIHFMMLRALHEHIKTLSDSNELMNFLSYSLGASFEQNDTNPYLKNLKYQVFIERYPKSEYRSEIESYQNEERQKYAKKLLSNARLDRVRMNYLKSLTQLKVILEWGPVLDVFAESLFERISIESEFAWRVTHKQWLSDMQLNQILKQDSLTPISQEERNQLSKDMFEQAQKDVDLMKKNLPQSPWTDKASELLKGYQKKY